MEGAAFIHWNFSSMIARLGSIVSAGKAFPSRLRCAVLPIQAGTLRNAPTSPRHCGTARIAGHPLALFLRLYGDCHILLFGPFHTATTHQRAAPKTPALRSRSVLFMQVSPVLGLIRRAQALFRRVAAVEIGFPRGDSVQRQCD